MVDISEKNQSQRFAQASGKISMSKEAFDRIIEGDVGKGDVLGVARLAGVMATKQTPSLIPLCHMLLIEGASIDFKLNEDSNVIEAICSVKTSGKTGAEMEAITGVSIALITIYDMCKSVDREMVIFDICLSSKSGGKSGAYTRPIG